MPEEHLFKASNNLLEFLAVIISLWIDVIKECLIKGDCALSMTDSTTAKGWIQKSNFIEKGEDPIQAAARVDAARKYASIFMKADIKGYSQWFPGKSNNVAVALLRDGHLRDDKLTLLLRSHFPEQMQEIFQISQLPSAISSWLISLLQPLPVSKQLRELHRTTGIELGNDGRSGASPSVATTSTSTSSVKSSKIFSLEHLQWLSEKDGVGVYMQAMITRCVLVRI